MTKEEIQKNSEHWYNKYKELEKENERLRTRCEQVRDEGTGYMQLLEQENATLKKQLAQAKDIINCLVHLGEFNENTDEEYLNYQVHDVLKQAEQFLNSDGCPDVLCEDCTKDCEMKKIMEQANKEIEK